MTNEELRDKLTRTYGWVNKLAKWRKNQEVNSVYGLRWLQRIHKLQLSLINQFKEDVANDIIQILWDDGNGFPCSREVTKKENCLQCKEIYKKIDEYLKSNS